MFGGIGHRTQAFRSGVRCSNPGVPNPNRLVATANRSSQKSKVGAAKRLPRKSHTCSMGLRSGDHAGQSIRSISSLSKSCSAATVRCHGALSSMKRNCRPIAPLKRRTYGRRISLQ
ncbi:hypothetical protein TNCV_4369121 [Trichonephila clavipes]|nr:hypothetical protein TNCV_4369121 [Trichonephila clavipes]